MSRSIFGKRVLSAGLAVALAGLGASCSEPARKAGLEPAPEQVASSNTVMPMAAWQALVNQRISESEYKIRAHTQAPYRAFNRASQFVAFFDEAGIRVEDKVAGREGVKLSLSSYGRAGAMRASGPGKLREGACQSTGEVDEYGVCLPRLEVERPKLLEYWQNSANGLEQGFVLQERPAGTGPLAFELSVVGAKVESMGERGARLVRKAGTQLQYTGLKAFDANGNELWARMEPARRGLRLVVDDAAARYPVTVDPLLATAAWQTESNQASASFGFSVAAAGDVNGDNLGDLLVGAPYYDNGSTDEGRVYVFHGLAAGPSTTPARTLEIDVAGAQFGYSVASAGDTNGDGHADIVVGAPGANSAYVYQGSGTGVDTTAIWSKSSVGLFGASVATVGDMNNDGFSDLVVGAPNYENGQTVEGAVFLYVGSSSGPSTTESWSVEANLIGANLGRAVASAGDVNGDGWADLAVGLPGYGIGTGAAWVFVSDGSSYPLTASWSVLGASGNNYGTSIASAGDVNGDGFADLLVGAPSVTNGSSYEGRAYLYQGSGSGLSTTASWTFEPNLANAKLGTSVASAGDVNGDGYADVLVGAPGVSNPDTAEGRAYLFLGTGGGLSATASWTAESNVASAGFGSSVASAGDVNGDGFSDAVIGAKDFGNSELGEGAAYVYLGTATGLSTTAAWTQTPTSGEASSKYGWSVARAGDVNKDGFGDVIVGAYQFNSVATDSGRVYLYLGAAAGLATTPSWTQDGAAAYSQLGWDLAGAGDVDADGYDDVIVSAKTSLARGTAYLYKGIAGTVGLAATAAWTVNGTGAQDEFGHSVAGGDVNGDGYADLIISSYGYANPDVYEGAVSVFFGKSPAPNTTVDWIVEGNVANLGLGSSVASAGDVDGDGFGDVIIGTAFYSNGETEEGRAQVFNGSPSGLTTASWTYESGQASARFGIEVAEAGDVDGDGFGDIVVGASGYTNTLTSQGRAFVFQGGPGGLPGTASWTKDGPLANALFGLTVSTAGDVNGDGFGDLIVGAPTYGNGQANEGAAFVYSGSNSGLLSTASWTVESNLASTQYGRTVSSAGDVNGDGFGDLIVGAWQYDNGKTADVGAAYVYFGGDQGAKGADRKLAQYQSDGTTLLAVGGALSGATAVLKGRVTQENGVGGKLRLEVEVKPSGTPYDGTGTVLSAAVNEGQLASVTVSGFGPDAYRWRARVVYAGDTGFGRWVSFGGNTESQPDFRVVASGAPKLAFTTGSQLLNAGSCSGITTVQTQDSSSAPISVTADTTINLSSGSATLKFYSNAGCGTELTSVVISSGTSSANFYFKDTTAGLPTVLATSAGFTDGSQVETITSAAAAALVYVSGNNQTGSVGSPLGSAFVVRVEDAFGNPVAGQTVNFTVQGGGGLISPSSVQSAANGQASATGTLGTVPGSNTFTASLGALTQTFTATGTVGAPTTLVKVSGDAQTGVAGTALASSFVVRLEDSYGNPVAGQTINFGVQSGGGGIAPSSVQSAANGQASAMATLGPTAGSNAFTASFGALTQTFTATGTAGTPTALVKVSGDAQSAVVGSTLSSPFVVRVEDSNGNPVAGVTVTFASSGGGSVAPSSVLSAANGQASATGTLSTSAGSNSFTASVGALTQSFTATGTAGAPAALVKVSGDAQTGAVGTTLSSPFVVRVEDAYGNPVAGRTVSFAVQSGSGGVAPSSMLSAANGQASATGTLGTSMGANSYTASLGALTQTFTATGTAGAPTALVKVSGDLQTGTVGMTLGSSLVVRVEDAYGNPVAGRTVNFVVQSGSGGIAPSSTLSAANGQASATATLGTSAGSNGYTASLGALTQTFTATGTAGAPTALVKVSGDLQTGTAGATLVSPFVVRVEDGYGNPVAGQTVNFLVQGGGGGIAPSSMLSAGNGQASATGTLGTGLGVNTFSASAGALTQTFTATGTAGAPAALVKVSGDAQTGTVGSTLGSPFVVRVEDAYGNPIAGRTVSFVVQSGSGGITPSSALSAANGQASATGTLGTSAGANSYTASLGALTQTFTATGTAAAPTALVKVSGDLQTGTVGATLASPFVVRLEDGYGNPIAGGTVTFFVQSGNGFISPSSMLTAANGQASASGTLGPAAGSNSYAASFGVLTQTFTATGTAGAPTALVKVSGDLQTGTVGTTLASPFVVRVEDAYGNPVSGRTISFLEQGGGGLISPSSMLSDANGQASASGTLGTGAGINSFTASFGALSQTFTATGIAGAPTAFIKVSGDGQTATVGGSLPLPFVVRVTDSFGNPVSGRTIDFNVVSGNGTVAPSSAQTAPNGEASATGTLGPSAGSNTFSATAQGLAVPALTFTATGSATSATSLVKVSGDGQSGFAGTALGAVLVVRAEDSFGNPVSGVVVTFTAISGNGGVSPLSAITDGAGLASTTATLGPVAGSNTFRAAAGALPAQTFTATGTVGPAAALVMVSGNNQSATVGSVLAPLVVRVEDAFGNPVDGYTVDFDLAGGNGSITPGSAVTASGGLASATATLGTVAGVNSFRATAAGLGGSPQIFGATGLAGAATALVKVSGDGQTGTVGSTLAAPFVVRVEDTFGNPVSGGTVTFNAQSGGGVSPPSVVSAANGQASATGTLGAIAGSNTFTATLGAWVQTFTATGLTGGAATLVKVSGDAQTGMVGSTLAAPFVVRVEDAFGNPLSGMTVSFSGGGGVSPASFVTGVDGQASANGTLGTTAGSNSFLASLGALSQTFLATGTAGPAATLVKVSGDLQTGLPGAVLAAPFVVRVEDSYGNPVAGTTVNFDVVSGTGGISPSIAQSAANGQASATGTLGTNAGNNSYRASAGALVQTFTATASAGAATALVKVSGDAQSGAVGTLLGAPFVVRAEDSFGNPVAGVTITFNVQSGSGNIAPTSVVTAANGQASATGTLGTNAGGNSFSASLGALSQTFTATGIAGAATSLVKVSGDAQSAPAGSILGSAFVVRVEDGYGNPVSGRSVSFSVLGGAGGISPSTVVSASNGQASATGTLGITAGSNSYRAALGALEQIFSATGTPGAAVALVKVSGDAQTGAAGSVLAAPLVVRVEDTYGNPVSGVSLNFTVLSGAGGIAPANAVSDAAGQASATATLGTTAGGNSYQVSFGSQTVTFTATGVAGAAARLVLTTPPRIFTAGACAGSGRAITLQLQDSAGSPASAGSLGVNLVAQSNSTGTVTWYTDAGCGTEALSGAFSLSPGQSTIDVYYMDTRAGSPMISFNSALTVPAPQVHTVLAAAAVALSFTSAPQSLNAYQCSAAASVELLDGFGNTALANSATQVDLSSDSPSMQFFADPACATTVTSQQISAGAASTSFYFQDSSIGTFTLTAANSMLAPANQTAVLLPGNAPTITSVPRRLTGAGLPYHYDQDDTIEAVGTGAITFSLVQGPPGFAVSPTGLVAWLPTQEGLFSIRVRASNLAGATEQLFDVKVATVPVITSTPSTTGNELEPYRYDADGLPEAVGSPTIGWSLSKGPQGALVTYDTGEILWTPLQSGTFNLVLRATNGFGYSEQDFNVVVGAATMPVIAPTANPTAQRLQAYVYDADGRVNVAPAGIPLRLVTGPAGFNVDPLSYEVTWVPQSAGTFTVELIAGTPPRESTPYSFQVTVVDTPPSPPTAMLRAIPASGDAPLDSLLDGSASSAAPGRALILYQLDPGDGSPPYYVSSVTHRYASPGGYAPTMTVIDELGNQATATASVQVSTGGLLPPLARILVGQYSELPNGSVEVALTCDCRDPQDQPLSYFWEFGDGDISNLPAPSHLFLKPGTYIVRLRVSNSLLSTKVSTQVVVKQGNLLPPEVHAYASPIVGPAPLHVSFTSSARDLDGMIVSRRWSFSDDASTSDLPEVEHDFIEPGFYVATLMAVDDDGLSSMDSVEITVLSPDGVYPPSFVSFGSRRAKVGEAYAYDEDGRPSVRGGRPLAFSLGRLEFGELAGVPPGAQIDPQSGRVDWIPSEAGVVRMVLSASNAAGTAYEELLISVDPSAPLVQPKPCGCSTGIDGVGAGLLLLAFALRRRARRTKP